MLHIASSKSASEFEASFQDNVIKQNRSLWLDIPLPPVDEPFSTMDIVDTERYLQTMFESCWDGVVDGRHRLYMLTSLRELCGLPVKRMTKKFWMCYIYKNDCSLLSWPEIIMLSRHNSSSFALLSPAPTLIDMFQSVWNYGRTFKLEYSLSYLHTWTGDNAWDKAAPHSIHDERFYTSPPITCIINFVHKNAAFKIFGKREGRQKTETTTLTSFLQWLYSIRVQL